MHYYARIFQNHNDPHFYVEFPDCENINTFGHSFDEAIKMASEALIGILESEFEKGFFLQKPKQYTGNEYHKIEVPEHIYLPYKLKQLRGKRPQKEIAKLLDISQQAYQKLEDPQKCNPRLKTLEQLANAFGVNAAELIS